MTKITNLTPTPSPSVHPSNIIREVGFRCSECGNKYIAYEASNSVRTPVTCPTCNCDVFGERLDYDEELKLDIEITQRRKKGEQVDNARSLNDYKRYRSRSPKSNRRKTAKVKPELDKHLK